LGVITIQASFLGILFSKVGPESPFHAGLYRLSGLSPELTLSQRVYQKLELK
jgi:hypothetical protein